MEYTKATKHGVIQKVVAKRRFGTMTKHGDMLTTTDIIKPSTALVTTVTRSITMEDTRMENMLMDCITNLAIIMVIKGQDMEATMDLEEDISITIIITLTMAKLIN